MFKGYCRDFGKPFGFTPQPDASSLVQDLLHDPDALENERHDPGIYDSDGDYVPQFSDDPERIARAIEANAGGAAPSAGAPGPDPDSSADSTASVSDHYDKGS